MPLVLINIPGFQFNFLLIHRHRIFATYGGEVSNEFHFYAINSASPDPPGKLTTTTKVLEAHQPN
jgi:hypothetical protein